MAANRGGAGPIQRVAPGIRRIARDAFDVDDGAGEAVEVAAVSLHDLELARPHPEAIAGAVRPDGVITAAAVADRFLARWPPSGAPLELVAQMVVVELPRCRQRAVDLAGHADRRSAVSGNDREHALGIAAEADRFDVIAFLVAQPGNVARRVWPAQECLPPVEVPSVEERHPSLFVPRGRDDGRPQARRERKGEQTQHRGAAAGVHGIVP